MSTVTLQGHMNIPLVNQVLGRRRRRQYSDELKRDVVAACTAPGVSMEYIHTVIQGWAKDMRVRLDYLQPGKPQRNAYVERFNRTVRYELLSQNHWSIVDEVQDVVGVRAEFLLCLLRSLPTEAGFSLSFQPLLAADAVPRGRLRL